MTLIDYEELTLQWSADRGILTNSTAVTQGMKLVSEIGELCDNIIKNKDVKDDIGDCLVVLTNIAALSGTNLTECWAHAWNDIKDRRGYLNEHGNFIKEADYTPDRPAKKQLEFSFETTKGFPITEVEITDRFAEASLYASYIIYVRTSDNIVTELSIDLPRLLTLADQSTINHSFIGKSFNDLKTFFIKDLKGKLV